MKTERRANIPMPRAPYNINVSYFLAKSDQLLLLTITIRTLSLLEESKLSSITQ